MSWTFDKEDQTLESPQSNKKLRNLFPGLWASSPIPGKGLGSPPGCVGGWIRHREQKFSGAASFEIFVSVTWSHFRSRPNKLVSLNCGKKRTGFESRFTGLPFFCYSELCFLSPSHIPDQLVKTGSDSSPKKFRPDKRVTFFVTKFRFFGTETSSSESLAGRLAISTNISTLYSNTFFKQTRTLQLHRSLSLSLSLSLFLSLAQHKLVSRLCYV